jgi:hypothetical protein
MKKICIKREKQMKNKKGITVVSLIITIVIILILIGVTVNVTLNEGLFTKAKENSSQLEALQIKNIVETVKTKFLIEAKNKKDIIIAKKELKERIATELGGKIEGEKVITPEEKYDIIVKNSDLDIEVVKHDDYIDISSIRSQEYTQTYTEVDGHKIAATININLGTLITGQNEYVNLKLEKKIQAPMNEKEKAVVDYLVSKYTMYTGATTIDEIVIKALVSNFGQRDYTTLEQWIKDTAVLNFATSVGITKLEKNHLYAYVLFGNITPVTKEDAIGTIYQNEVLKQEINKTIKEYKDATGELLIIIKKDGENFSGKYLKEGDKYCSFNVYENGIYEISIGNYTSPANPVRVEFLNESIIVNNLECIANASSTILMETDIDSEETTVNEEI